MLEKAEGNGYAVRGKEIYGGRNHEIFYRHSQCG